MIKKSIISGLLFLSFYSIYIYFNKPNWNTAQHDFQENIIKAQNYLFENNHYKNVFVGSSLSARLEVNAIPNTYNLSMAGGSIFDGLNIILKKQDVPTNVFIEMNIVERPENEKLNSAITEPISSFIKKNIPITRENYQPIGVFVSKIYSKFDNITYKKDSNVLNKLVNDEIERNSLLPNQQKLDENFIALQNTVSLLIKNKINIIFYEMPMNLKVCHLQYPKKIREQFYKNFPKTTFKYIDLPNCNDYETSDGKHLTKEEAQLYLKYFILNVNGHKL